MSSVCENTKTRKCFVDKSSIIPRFHFHTKHYCKWYKKDKERMFFRLKTDRECLHFAITCFSITKDTIGLSNEEEQIFREIKALN